jgi:hypothetical protein
MAQYFTPPRQQTSRDQPLPANGPFKLKLATLDESAVYVFPNPSSAPTTSIPSSPSQASDFSIPTELTLSAIESDSNGSNRPPLFSNSPHSPTPAWQSQLIFPELSYGGVETPTSSVTDDSSGPASPVDQDFAKTGATAEANADDWRARLMRYRETFLPHFLREFTSSQQTADIEPGLDDPSATPPSHCHSVDHLPLPFLSFIHSLFSIDESTVELLRSDLDTSKSALFPGNRLHALDDEKATLMKEINGDEPCEEELHGLAKLLVEEKLNSHYAVRRAFWEVRRDSDSFSN